MAESSENGECEPRKEKIVEETDGSILVLQSQEFEQEKSNGVEAVSETVSVRSKHTKRKTEGKDESSQKKQHLIIDRSITFTLDINVDDHVKNSTTVVGIEYKGPLDQEELLLAASQTPPPLFLVRFPTFGNNFAYLDTRLKTLSFRALPQKTDLSVLMKLVNVGGLTNPKYQWSTKVIPDSYLTVTMLNISGARRVRFNNYTPVASAPAWEVQADPTDEFLLSFSTISANIRWYLTPKLYETQIQRQVVAVEDQQYAMNVYQVTNYDDETLPFAIIVP